MDEKSIKIDLIRNLYPDWILNIRFTRKSSIYHVFK